MLAAAGASETSVRKHKGGFTALMQASTNGHTEVVTLLEMHARAQAEANLPRRRAEQKKRDAKRPRLAPNHLREKLGKLGLLGLVDLLSEEGAKTLADLALLSEADMKEIGIKRKVDRVKLMKAGRGEL